MKVEFCKEAVLLAGEAGITPWIWGHNGVGKSSIVKQTADENGMGFLDFRLSQCEASDLRGMPYADKENSKTIFLAPSDLPVGGLEWEEYIEILDIPDLVEKAFEDNPKEIGKWFSEEDFAMPFRAYKILKAARKFVEATVLHRRIHDNQRKLNTGILFLDELNRAQDDVIQATFQLVLDHAVGSYVLPAGWQIVVAGNYTEGYQTNGFNDAAFVDRFAHISLDSGSVTQEDWVNYMIDTHGEECAQVLNYVANNPEFLDGPSRKTDMGFPIMPSRRSWEFAVNVNKAFKASDSNYSMDALVGLLAGLIGPENAMGYLRYDCPVKPQQIIDDGIKPHESALNNLDRNQVQSLVWGLAGFVKDRQGEKKIGQRVKEFTKWMVKNKRADQDMAVAFVNIICGINNEHVRAMTMISPKAALMISKYVEKEDNSFIHILKEDPELSKLLSDVSLGEDTNKKKS